ncbi:hypothetical protein Sste5346_009955 [Sporothrix stenoceras]|uniref:Cyclohexanone monooxygenase n=1 Tax=Sporothrix stenoceras TaxID=5173 RepID=A0ABR3YHQ1_9PEZI
MGAFTEPPVPAGADAVNTATQDPVLLDGYGSFLNNDSSCPVESEDAEYTVAEHLLWAPRKLRVACVGAGASGIMFCYKKEKEFGDDLDLVVYERQSQPGGVWTSNKYPGCRCDVPSPAYQFSFAPKADWPMFYSGAEEIQKYYSEYAYKNGYVDKYIKLQHTVTKAEWVEAAGKWNITVQEQLPSGEIREFEDSVDFLLNNIGVLHTWKWPAIPNREAFKGTMAHSADYDTSIDLKDKRVAVIGSGASAIQVVPAVAKEAAQVVSFYRTPQWISPGMPFEGFTESGHNFTFTEEQKKRFEDDPAYYLECRKKIENNINKSFPVMLKGHPMQNMGRERLTERMAVLIDNRADLVKKIIPDFAMGCRRLGTGEDFLMSLTTPKVSVADSQVASFTETGVQCEDGSTMEFDVIICATGFDVTFRPSFEILGRDGRKLRDEWVKDPEAYLALAASGYPNFIVGSLGPNCPAGHGSFVTILEIAQNYACKMLRKMQTENILALDVKPEVVRDYNEHVHKWLQRTVWSAGCRSWFNQGKPGGKITAQYPGSLMHWREMLFEPRYEDYSIKYRGPNRFKYMGNGFTKREVNGEDLSFYLDPEYIAKPLFDH